jgi:hypothetical protein
MDPTISDRFLSVIQALHDTGHIEDSCSDDIPKPIRNGHPVRRAVKQLRKHYPGERLPIRGRREWKRLVRLSRRQDDQVFEAADSFLMWLQNEERFADPLNVSDLNDLPDGLIEAGNRLKAGGRIIKLRLQQWRLLKFVWDKSAVSQGDLEDELWPDEVVEAATVRQAVKRANDVLERVGIAWRLSQGNAQLIKVCSE